MNYWTVLKKIEKIIYVKEVITFCHTKKNIILK